MKDNFDKQLYNMLPPIYRKEDAKIKPHPEPLKRFLKILHEGGFKPLIERIESLQNLTDIDNADPNSIHLLVQTLGLDFPYNMSDKERRKYLKIIPSIYKSKGTADSFNFLAREIFSTKTKIHTRAEIYKEGMTPEEWRRIFIDIEVDGALPDLQRKEENFRKFVEIVRPVNRILVINLILAYYTEYKFAERVRDSFNSEIIIVNPELYRFMSSLKDEVDSSILKLKTETEISHLKPYDYRDPFYLNSSTLNNLRFGLSSFYRLDKIKEQPLLETVKKYVEGISFEAITESATNDSYTSIVKEASPQTKFTVVKPSNLSGSTKLVTNFYITHYTPKELTLNY